MHIGLAPYDADAAGVKVVVLRDWRITL